MNSNKSKIEDQLLIRFLNEDVLPEEKEKVESWLDADDENRLYLERVKSVWKDSSAIRLFDQIDVDKNWNDVSSKLGFDSAQKSRQVFMLPRVMKIAAAIILIAAFGFLVSQFTQRPAEMMTLTATGSGTSIELPDGTEVWLNQGSQLIYPSRFASSQREVELKGEGYFEVEHDPNHPFLVNVGPTQTKVLGTSFNLREATAANPTELVLVTGKVQFTLGANQVILAPGDRVVVDENGELVKEVNPDLNFMAWKTRTLIYENVKMEQVIEDITKLYKINVTIEDSSFMARPLNAKFENDPIEEVMESIELIFGVEVTKQGDNYIIK